MEVPGSAQDQGGEGTERIDAPRIVIELPIFEGLDEAGNTVWRAQAEESVVDIDERARMGEITGLIGEILEGGEVASRFRAGRGIAEERTQALVLSEGVSVTSERDGFVLEAQSVRWDSETERIVAEGTVTLTSDVYGLRSGPFEEVWATPDLSRIATPDMFLPSQ